MILKRNTQFNLSNLGEQYGHLFPGSVDIMEFARLLQIYNGAMSEVATKLEILDEEFSLLHKHNPIHYIECRIKGPISTFNKLSRYGLAPTLENIRGSINDIAGIRVVCNFLSDIYEVEDMLLSQNDVVLTKRKDYIANPKENGYRSLHLVVKVPVFLSDSTEMAPVEIQLRTSAMDYWANLEHLLRYKNDGVDVEQFSGLLLQCANSLAGTEEIMEQIFQSISM
ncbi:MAG: GTP pyrophosphokinase family protein [Eubacteriaceae bacterium]|nr:GTP pyrophosphokinase family protein [Eubacteriaceae bacterium]